LSDATAKIAPVRRGLSARPAPRATGCIDALHLALHHAQAMGPLAGVIAGAVRQLLRLTERKDEQEAA
jgi:hypothetical protein